MSAIKEAIDGIRVVLKMTDDIKAAAEHLKEIARELRAHDQRITRLEARLDTMVDMARLTADQPAPRRLPGKVRRDDP